MIKTYTHNCKCSRCGEWFSFVMTGSVGPTSTTGFACPPCSKVLNEIAAEQQQRAMSNMFGGPWARGAGPGYRWVADPVQEQLSSLHEQTGNLRVEVNNLASKIKSHSNARIKKDIESLQERVTNVDAAASRRHTQLDHDNRHLDAMIDSDRRRINELDDAISSLSADLADLFKRVAIGSQSK